MTAPSNKSNSYKVSLIPQLSKRRKILLVVVPQDGEVRDKVTHKYFKNPVVKYMPLGVLSLAASIKDQHDVSILDASSRGLTVEQTIQEIESHEPEILGLSVVTYRAWAMRKILEKTTAPIKVVGGPHATSNANYIIQQGADAVFIGDAEYNFSEWLSNGCPAGVHIGKMADLNTIALPARELVDLDDYRIIPNEKLLFNVGTLRLPMFSSKGCAYKCTYCDVQQKTFNWKSPETVLNEFHKIIDLGATSIHILDDCFNIKRDRIIAMSKLLVDDGISIDWSARGMVEVREPVIAALAQAGCKRLHVGIEHLDDNVLRNFQKQQRYSMVEKFCKLCSEYGIHVLAYFILGAPGETRDYRLTLPEKIRELKIAIPYFNILTPLADTTYYNEVLESGLINKDFWDEFSRNPTRDFEIPSVRSTELEEEIEQTLSWYIELFNTKKGDNIIPPPKYLSNDLNLDQQVRAEFI